MRKLNPEDYKIIDGGYASNKSDYEAIKATWNRKNPKAKIRRVRTDTKGLLMYEVIVLKNEED